MQLTTGNMGYERKLYTVLTDTSFLILRELYRLNVPYGSEYVSESGSGDGDPNVSLPESKFSFSMISCLVRACAVVSWAWGSGDAELIIAAICTNKKQKGRI